MSSVRSATSSRQMALAANARNGSTGRALEGSCRAKDGSIPGAPISRSIALNLSSTSHKNGPHYRPCIAEKIAKPSDCRPVSYTHLRAHETVLDLVCRLLL